MNDVAIWKICIVLCALFLFSAIIALGWMDRRSKLRSFIIVWGWVIGMLFYVAAIVFRGGIVL